MTISILICCCIFALGFVIGIKFGRTAAYAEGYTDAITDELELNKPEH